MNESREGLHRGRAFDMILQKSSPRLRGALTPTRLVFARTDLVSFDTAVSGATRGTNRG
jgi:hypothetical protein